MKPTGKYNRITGEEIMKSEHHDVPWEKTWEELTDVDKVHFMSYMNYQFLNKDVEPAMKVRYEYLRKEALKNRGD
jgi:hypothetical protein